MMRTTLYLTIAVILFSCKTETKIEKQENPVNDPETLNVFKNVEKSEVVVTLDGEDYKVAVNCSFFGEDYFYFKSDKLETTDTNGDGIVITGHQQDDKMILTLIVEGKTYSAANLAVQKKEFTAKGAGKLFLQDTNEYVALEATYIVSCR